MTEKEEELLPVTIIRGWRDRRGRSYSYTDLNKIVERGSPLFGGLDNSYGALHMEQISHSVTDLYLDDNGNLHGKIKILDTPQGNILRILASEHVSLRTAIRGTGMVDGDGNVTNFTLISVDLVPSDNV